MILKFQTIKILKNSFSKPCSLCRQRTKQVLQITEQPQENNHRTQHVNKLPKSSLIHKDFLRSCLWSAGSKPAKKKKKPQLELCYHKVPIRQADQFESCAKHFGGITEIRSLQRKSKWEEKKKSKLNQLKVVPDQRCQREEL